jgi:hypothetical protein
MATYGSDYEEYPMALTVAEKRGYTNGFGSGICGASCEVSRSVFVITQSF